MKHPHIPRSRRTESVAQKVNLLKHAFDAGRYDLVASLADSIKDSIEYERQTGLAEAGGTLQADNFVRVRDLPLNWSHWAAGWEFCKPVRLFETVGIRRDLEPVVLVVAFRDEQLTDPYRELRVAEVTAGSNELREIPAQVWGDRRSNGVRSCRLAFQARIDQHSDATYLIFYGNAFAELPNYETDLKVGGETWRLNIENEYFIAQLSHQMGQLARLTSKRQHGLELYAGGKGHGEPPTIDWAHDYVEEGGFQKLRIKDWEECRNFEVVRGPVCTQIRRWGFPRSPIHPLISPTRMHVDVTYTFWAGLPVFFKHSAMEAVVDFGIEAMRDDEWVFSSYSFDKSLWIDAAGKLHEGPVPGQHQENLWGVGFANATSQDAFLALWLEHQVSGRDEISHGGVPTLHYAGHGQLWSRYPAQRTTLAAGTRFERRNAYLLTLWDDDAPARIEQQRHRWLNPLESQADAGSLPTNVTAGPRPLARPGETADSAGPKQQIYDTLREVIDDQLYGADANIIDLGYVYDVRFRAGVAHIVVTMPHRGRPMHEFLVTQGGGRVDEGIRERVLRIAGVDTVVVTPTWNPPWSLARLTAAGRRAVGLD